VTHEEKSETGAESHVASLDENSLGKKAVLTADAIVAKSMKPSRIRSMRRSRRGRRTLRRKISGKMTMDRSSIMLKAHWT